MKLTGQPFQVLAILLERPGQVVTREELQKRLWPDTFVDVDHNLNTAINKIREALGDLAENPRFVETLPRRGYRFLAPVVEDPGLPWRGLVEELSRETRESRVPSGVPSSPRSLFAVAVVARSQRAFFVDKRLRASRVVSPADAHPAHVRSGGLQIGATWSPDGRSSSPTAPIVAASSTSGCSQVSGGDPVQITQGTRSATGSPDWSPDGKYIAYRSEEGGGRLVRGPRPRRRRGSATENRVLRL